MSNKATRAKTKQIVLDLPESHAAQQSIRDGAARFNVVCCGRRFGKTLLSEELLIDPALQGKPTGYFSPTYKNLAPVWRDVNNLFAPVILESNAQERWMRVVGDGVIEFWSLDSPVAIRGRKYARVLVDEAAAVAGLEEAWLNIIRPCLTDLEGDAYFFSTPHGLNYFYTLYRMGLDPQMPAWRSWQFPSSANPYLPPGEIEAARNELPDDVFRQEYLAEFLQGDGAVFRNILPCLVADRPRPEDHTSHRVVAGVDWAQKADFTVISVFCTTCQREVELDRYNKIDWAFQRARLRASVERWNVVDVLAEENSIGSPNIEALQQDGMRVRPFQTTPVSKPPLIRSLALAFERAEARWLDDPVATAELMAYETKVSPLTGRPSFSAPEGQHDDTVIARALAWWAVSNARRWEVA